MPKSVCEEKTFETIFVAKAAYLRNFMYYKTGDYQRAEDLMQDSFGKLWENCKQVSIDKAQAFLFKVANNLFLNQEQHQKVVLKFEQRRPTTKNAESPQFLLEAAEFEKRLKAAIQALPEGQREVFLMNRIDKLKYREIAEKLSISIKAVEKRMHKALVALRKISKRV